MFSQTLLHCVCVCVCVIERAWEGVYPPSLIMTRECLISSKNHITVLTTSITLLHLVLNTYISPEVYEVPPQWLGIHKATVISWSDMARSKPKITQSHSYAHVIHCHGRNVQLSAQVLSLKDFLQQSIPCMLTPGWANAMEIECSQQACDYGPQTVQRSRISENNFLHARFTYTYKNTHTHTYSSTHS